jgi:Ni,Fe-hydrogenase III small subunit/NAD-dependent dihydropyrimidine dehydrogenase PreA subunit
MFGLLRERWRQGYRTSSYPLELPVLPDRFRGRPVLDPSRCPTDCQECLSVCPTDALSRNGTAGLHLDLGKCLFCGDCVTACPEKAIQFTNDVRLATRGRSDLVLTSQTLKLAEALEEKMRRLFGRSLKLREVSAAGCNGCEADVNVLGTVVFDLGRFGIQFVASPRHADGLLITGPVSQNMREPLRLAYEAVPAPKVVIAVGACAIAGGPFRDHPEVHNGADGTVPVDLYIPGCPPHPWTILDGLLRLLGRLSEKG